MYWLKGFTTIAYSRCIILFTDVKTAKYFFLKKSIAQLRVQKFYKKHLLLIDITI